MDRVNQLMVEITDLRNELIIAKKQLLQERKRADRLALVFVLVSTPPIAGWLAFYLS